MYKNQINGNEYSSLSGMVRSLRLCDSTPKEYYDKFLLKENDGICKQCGKETMFQKFVYRSFCNTKCAAQFNKNSATIWKCGEDKRTEMSKKLSTSMKRNWKDPSKKAEMLFRRESTTVMKFGFGSKELHRKQMNDFYLGMTPEARKEFFDKSTMAPRKGNGRKYKKYVLDGFNVYVQGYEPFVLDILKKIYKESELSIERKNMFRYNSTEGTVRRYFPDIVIGDIVIEVKSRYTVTTDKELLNKLNAVKVAGKIPVLVVWDTKQVDKSENDLIETISSQVTDSFSERFNDYPFIGVGDKQMISEVLGVKGLYFDDDIVCSLARVKAVSLPNSRT